MRLMRDPKFKRIGVCLFTKKSNTDSAKRFSFARNQKAARTRLFARDKNARRSMRVSLVPLPPLSTLSTTDDASVFFWVFFFTLAKFSRIVCLTEKLFSRRDALLVFGLARVRRDARSRDGFEQPLDIRRAPVSYTHLTLPTICSV